LRLTVNLQYRPLSIALLLCFFVQSVGVQASATQHRLDDDSGKGNSVVVHLVVALADNKHRWIVSIPLALGESQNARTNLALRLDQVSAHGLLLTTGLMAPEAFSSDAAITQWVAGAHDMQIRKAAADNYNRYQKSGIKAARRLFDVR
jgi:hypothetical protein